MRDEGRELEAWRLMVAASGKLRVLQQLLPRLLAGGHRVLLFSQSIDVREGSWGDGVGSATACRGCAAAPRVSMCGRPPPHTHTHTRRC